MPVLSYLALPHAGRKQQLHNELAVLEHCEVVLSDNEEVVLLVTDTPDQQAEKRLQRQLKKIASLQSLSMVFGHTAEQLPNNQGKEATHEA